MKTIIITNISNSKIIVIRATITIILTEIKLAQKHSSSLIKIIKIFLSYVLSTELQ